MATTETYRGRGRRRAAAGIPEATNAALAAGFFLLQIWLWLLLPLYFLPASFDRIGAGYDDGFFRAALRRINGPLARDKATAVPGNVQVSLTKL